MMMGAAIYEFGSMDALGHLPILLILVATLAEGADRPEGALVTLRGVMLAPIAKGVALGAVFVSYYMAHDVFQGVRSLPHSEKRAATSGPEEPHPSHASGLTIGAVARSIQP